MKNKEQVLNANNQQCTSLTKHAWNSYESDKRQKYTQLRTRPLQLLFIIYLVVQVHVCNNSYKW